jgi:hypothetical protein
MIPPLVAINGDRTQCLLSALVVLLARNPSWGPRGSCGRGGRYGMDGGEPWRCADAVTGGWRMRVYSRQYSGAAEAGIGSSWPHSRPAYIPRPLWLDARASRWRCWVVSLVSRYTFMFQRRLGDAFNSRAGTNLGICRKPLVTFLIDSET